MHAWAYANYDCFWYAFTLPSYIMKNNMSSLQNTPEVKASSARVCSIKSTTLSLWNLSTLPLEINTVHKVGHLNYFLHIRYTFLRVCGCAHTVCCVQIANSQALRVLNLPFLHFTSLTDHMVLAYQHVNTCCMVLLQYSFVTSNPHFLY